jgi:hypothetical protein
VAACGEEMEGLDLTALASGTVALLAPLMPFLVQAGEEATKQAAQQFGKGAWERGSALWAIVRPALNRNPAALHAAGELARQDGDLERQVLTAHLLAMLKEDAPLASRLAAMGGDAIAVHGQHFGHDNRFEGGNYLGGQVSIGGDVIAQDKHVHVEEPRPDQD